MIVLMTVLLYATSFVSRKIFSSACLNASVTWASSSSSSLHSHVCCHDRVPKQ